MNHHNTQLCHTLYDDHSDWLKGLLHSRVGCPQLAEDLTHDAFVRILGKSGLAEVLREPRSFLATVANGLVIDWYRKRALERAYLEVLATLPEPQVPSLEEQAIMLEALAEIDRMLDGLRPRVRRVFLLAHIDGLTYTRIAERLGISMRTVNSDIAQAMEHCARCLP